MNATLRVTGSGDLELFAALEAEVLAEDPWTPYIIVEELSPSVSRYWTATDESGGVARYGGVKVSGNQANVMIIGVRAHARGRGIGSTILGTLLEWSRETGVREAFPDVRPSNKEAIGLYESRGFAEVGRRPCYFRNSAEEAVEMRASLI